jgi:hypothetical protein
MSPVACPSGAAGATRAAAAAAAAARLSARRCAAQTQTPLLAPASGRRRAHRQPCAGVTADGQAVCPVGVTQVHATEPPTGLPNLALRPVSEAAVSSSKALEAFRASGAANRACPATKTPPTRRITRRYRP